MRVRRNSENPRRGREFQQLAASVLGKHWGVPFELEVAFAIGRPPKEHRFDLSSADRQYVGETKNYTWTETGNMPSAKMAFINEAVFYLSHLPAEHVRFVAMLRDVRPRTGEPLADYYYRTYRHLLNGVKVIEIDPATGGVREVGGASMGNGRSLFSPSGGDRPGRPG